MNIMETFKKGDIVICKVVGGLVARQKVCPPLSLNAEYVVGGVNTCPCGEQFIDVGLSFSDDSFNCICGRKTFNETIWWCNAKRFVKKDIRSYEEQLEEAVANEDYDKASVLRDKINNGK